MVQSKHRSRGMRESRGDRLFLAINTALCVVLLLIFIYPLYFVVIASVSDPYAVWNGEVLLAPIGLNLRGYEKIMTYTDILMGYGNSILYTVGSILLGLFFTVSAAYPLAQKDFPVRQVISKLFMFTMFFSGGMIPLYFTVRTLGMLNTPLAIILPGAASFGNIIITRTYFQSSIPGDLREAAFLDGCSHFTYLIRIALPLSKSILAVMALYYGVAQWNSFFNAMIYIKDRSLYPLQLILREILLTTDVTMDSIGDPNALVEQQKLAEVIKYGVIVVSAVPAMIAYPMVQKHFVKGVMIGSLKG